MAYTYLIGWSDHNKYYYGVRYSKNCDPSDLWVTYFTSSKYVHEFRKQYGEPNIIEIRKTFDNTNKARLWEHKVLKKMNVIKEDKWLNKTDNVSIDPLCAIKGTLSHIGKKRSEKTIQKMRGPKTLNHRKNMMGKRPNVNQTGSKNNAFKGLIVTPFGIFESLFEASKVDGIHYSTISLRIKNENFKEYMRLDI